MPSITVSESSLLRSPTASQGEGGALGEETARARGNTVGIRDNALDIAKWNGLLVSRVVDNLFPTPVASEGLKAPAQQTSETKGKTGQVWLSNVAKDLEPSLPTPTASDWKGANNSGSGTTSSNGSATKIDNLGTNWGKFEPAIRRWEGALGRPAPAPTKPDGKDGAHRLSSAFTEWMMGLPEGWITDVGLSRNDELKACGNGVVPQQAELALRVLLEGLDIETKRGGGLTVLPTPTVMDQRDGKHFRSVAIRELADGNNRGLNLNNIVESGLTNWEEGDKFEIVEGKAVKTNG